MTDKPNTPDDNAAENAPDNEEQQPVENTEVSLAYAGTSEVSTSEGTTELKLFGNLKRDPVSLTGKVKQPLRLREALGAMYGIVGSDYRYVPKDRTRYIAYQRMKRETANQSVWQAQQAYFDWLQRNDPLAWLILDPIISVHPDQVMFEVFSKDEGTYAKLSLNLDALEIDGDITHGTTNIDFSESLNNGVTQMRSYRETLLKITQEASGVATEETGEVLEKEIRVADSWIRGFLQVQSAATLPHETFKLAPMDLYNVLRHLRMNADEKRKRRGLRVELTPGEQPTLVLEPWETVITGTGDAFTGTVSKVIRVWGRRRLMLLRRLLPFLEEIEVHVLGSGLPSFWVLKAQDMTLTLGMTGFTSANWSQAACFDLLLPRKTQGSQELEAVVKHLSKKWFDTAEGIGKATKLKGAALLEALQMGCQQGQLMLDLAEGVYRLRPLTREPLDLERLQYRNQRERIAHDLLSRRSAVSIVSENRIYGSGLEITGKVNVKEDKREYRPQFLLNEDGNVSRAECTCTLFRKQGLKDGPCTHLIALRLAWAKAENERLTDAKARKSITVETRTYSRRDEAGQEEVYQLTLDRKRVRVRWGQPGQKMRLQTMQFNSLDEARADYLARLEDLNAKGYLDATTG